jgi:excisionase family DNA binding protein
MGPREYIGRGPTLEEIVEDAVTRAVRRELAGLREEMAAIRAAVPPQMISVADAAKRTGLCEATIRRQIKDGEIRCKRVGRRVLVDVSSLRADPPGL